jgi:hypothetical protein
MNSMEKRLEEIVDDIFYTETLRSAYDKAFPLSVAAVIIFNFSDFVLAFALLYAVIFLIEEEKRSEEREETEEVELSQIQQE